MIFSGMGFIRRDFAYPLIDKWPQALVFGFSLMEPAVTARNTAAGLQARKPGLETGSIEKRIKTTAYVDL